MRFGIWGDEVGDGGDVICKMKSLEGGLDLVIRGERQQVDLEEGFTGDRTCRRCDGHGLGAGLRR